MEQPLCTPHHDAMASWQSGGDGQGVKGEAMLSLVLHGPQSTESPHVHSGRDERGTDGLSGRSASSVVEDNLSPAVIT
ncbi:hypothetical protein NQZ68_005245 [Dissostichus eleginoides]|nr:hypothetical protein NQZ68_005245 [Dissostichus eleginoides]